MSDILQKIAATKREEITAARARRPLDDVMKAAEDASPPRDFFGAIAASPPRAVHLIAEIKKKSPSAGLIRPDFEPAQLATIYYGSKASALSVLTDVQYFGGHLSFLQNVRDAVPLPVLRKDFMLEPYQIYESRAAGADAVLLIGELLAPELIRELLELSHSLGMTTLIEVHDRATLEALLAVVDFPNKYRSLLGINNRDLKIQQTDLATTERLAGMVGPGTLLVSESGVKTRADVERLHRAGARALLIGETFMRADDISAKIDDVLGSAQGQQP